MWRLVPRGQPLRFLDVALIALNALFYFSAVSGLLHKRHAGWEGLCEAAAGVACLAAAWMLRTDSRGALTAYVTGHALVLLGLGVETVDWVTQSASPQNYLSIASASISVLAGAYAVMLVALGSARRHAATRILGDRPVRNGGGEAVSLRRLAAARRCTGWRRSRFWACCCWRPPSCTVNVRARMQGMRRSTLILLILCRRRRRPTGRAPAISVWRPACSRRVR